MRVFVLATVLLASSSLYPSFAQEEGKVRLQPRKPEFLPRLIRNPSNSRINEPAATNRGLTTERWVATG